jgi:sulfate permease, SulP family
VAIGRTLADPNDTRTGAAGANRELIAQGSANFVSSFIGAIPGSASFSRSLLDRAAGAMTRASGPIGAIAVALLALAFAPAGAFLPYATLAGILVVIAIKLVDVRFFASLYRHHRSDFVVCLVTALATVLLPLQYAVFVGVGLNLLLQLLVASRLRAYELVPTREGGFRESQPEDACDRSIRVLQLDGNLFFALGDAVESLLKNLERSTARVVVLRLRNTHSIDASLANSVVAFAKRMRAAGRHVLLCGLRGTTLATFEARFAAIPGGTANTLFASNDELLQSLGNAMNEARRLTGQSPVAPRDAGEWVYVI